MLQKKNAYLQICVALQGNLAFRNLKETWSSGQSTCISPFRCLVPAEVCLALPAFAWRQMPWWRPSQRVLLCLEEPLPWHCITLYHVWLFCLSPQQASENGGLSLLCPSHLGAEPALWRHADTEWLNGTLSVISMKPISHWCYEEHVPCRVL